MTKFKKLTDFITENFRIKDGETVSDTTIRLLTRLKNLVSESETEEIVTIIKGKYGREKQVYKLQNKDTGELIRRRVEIVSYYNTGEIDEIRQKAFDGEGNLLRQRIIKHFRDGRQPKIIEEIKE